MHPIIFKIGPLTIYSYGLFLALGFLTAVWLAGRQVKVKADFDHEKVADLGIVILIAAITGARLTYVLLNLDEYLQDPIEIIWIHHGGLVFYGGLIAGLLAGWLLVRHWKLDFLKVSDAVIPYLPLGQAIGRIGCLLNGCCYGLPTNLVVGISLPGHEGRLWPTQIYSSLALLAVFIVLRICRDRVKTRGIVTGLYGMLYPAVRFSIEFWRGDVPRLLWGLTFSQMVSLLIFGAAVVFVVERAGRK